MSTPTYQVKNWDIHFEGAKSKTYNNKTTCSIPTKHGLGYKMLVKKGGADCFGAWCALIQVLSRHHKPRTGFCTVDGTRTGRPYTSADLEVLTDIQSKVYDKMFLIVSSPEVDWVSVVNDCKDTTGNQTDTTGNHEGGLVPLNSNSDSDSNSDLDSDSYSSELAEATPSRNESECFIKIPMIPSHGDHKVTMQMIEEWESCFPNVDVPQTLREIRAWCLANPSKCKTRTGVMRFLTSWMNREQNKGGR